MNVAEEYTTQYKPSRMSLIMYLKEYQLTTAAFRHELGIHPWKPIAAIALATGKSVKKAKPNIDRLFRPIDLLSPIAANIGHLQLVVWRQRSQFPEVLTVLVSL